MDDAMVPRRGKDAVWLVRILVVAAVLIGLGTLARPLGQDASAHFGGIHHSFAAGYDLGEAFTFRGPTYNAYLAGLYVTATSVVDFFDRSAFDPLVIALQLLLVTGAGWLWGSGLGRRFALGRGACVACAALAVIAASSNIETVILHTEQVAVVVTFAAWGLAMRSRTGWQVVAGLLLATLPLMKGVTAVYAAPVLLSALLQHGWRSRSFRVLLGVTLATAVGLVAILAVVAPVSLRDLTEFAVYQDSLGGPVAARFTTFANSWRMFLTFNPLLVAGLPALILHVAELLRRHDRGELLLVLGLWSIAPFSLLLQQQYFTYHAMPVVLGATYSLSAVLWWCRPVGWTRVRTRTAGSIAVFTTVLTWREAVGGLGGGNGWTLILLAVALVVTGLTVLQLLSWLGRTVQPSVVLPRRVVAGMLALAATVWVAYPRAMPTPARSAVAWERASVQEAGFDALVDEYDLRGEEVLLLAFAAGMRHLDVVSACRHWFPIPVQRYQPERDAEFRATSGFQENLDCILDYDGEYLIQEQDWFRTRALPEVSAFARDYERIADVTIGPRSYFVARRRAP